MSMVVGLLGTESTGMLRGSWLMQIFTLTLSDQRNLSGEILHMQKIGSTRILVNSQLNNQVAAHLKEPRLLTQSLTSLQWNLLSKLRLLIEHSLLTQRFYCGS